MADNPPYLLSPGTLKKALDKIQTAQTPPRFTADFVATIIGIKGGSGRALIPFFKRVGFVRSDGTPAELYNQFRNPATSGRAAAEALRNGFGSLYQLNEYIHQASDDDLKAAVMQITGLPHDSRVVAAVVGTFKVLKYYARPDEAGAVEQPEAENGLEEAPEEPVQLEPPKHQLKGGLNLSYTINLNLPPTADVRVFDAIFRSLKENLLKE